MIGAFQLGRYVSPHVLKVVSMAFMTWHVCTFFLQWFEWLLGIVKAPLPCDNQTAVNIVKGDTLNSLTH